jgi:hypothetical protein
MTDFIARIELIDLPANKDNRAIYEELHKQMEGRGFTRQLPTENGLRWMPDATYFYRGDAKLEDISKKARDVVTAAKQTGRFFFGQLLTSSSANLLAVEQGKGKG